jgi:hypothetical protein
VRELRCVVSTRMDRVVGSMSMLSLTIHDLVAGYILGCFVHMIDFAGRRIGCSAFRMPAPTVKYDIFMLHAHPQCDGGDVRNKHTGPPIPPDSASGPLLYGFPPYC